jgi:DDE superfamily endonuclease
VTVSRGLADLGYEGEPDILTIPFKKPKSGTLTVDQQAYNAVHGALRCLGERANSLLKTTYKACAAIVVAPGASAGSSRPLWSCSITRTTGPRDLQRLITQRSNR